MLSEATRPYIDASVPVLREHGLAITRHFYDSMFAAHPELQNIFNMSNQANGSQQQSLAAAVFAYAANYRNPEALAPVIERITHKHASLGVKPAHYAIVGQHLLGAIKAILGEAATPELMAAWDEAYWVLAGELIACEARLYQSASVAAGETMKLVVKAVRTESEQIKSFYLQTADGHSPGAFHPGQYVSVSGVFDGIRQLRQYSLSDAPDQPWWRISVKREDQTQPAGKVSNWLHTEIREGDVLEVSPAFGDFRPAIDAATPIALISAGVGITPMVSVLKAIATRNPQRPVLFAHATHHGRRHALRAEVHDMGRMLKDLCAVHFYETPNPEDQMGEDYQHEGRMSLPLLDQARLADADVYLCGPSGFMRQQWRDLVAAGVAPSRIHREVFGPELLDHLQ